MKQKLIEFVINIGTFVHKMAWPFRRWYFPRHPRTRIIMKHAGKILLVRGWLSDGCWSLPGGGLHRNEEAKSAARRELFEELGISTHPEELKVYGEIKVFQDDYKTNYFVFRHSLNVEPEIVRQWHEIADFRWVSKNELINLSLCISTKAILARWSKQG
ncbi:MAG: NUDIX hydrolase [Patescibacteria group bacterium]